MEDMAILYHMTIGTLVIRPFLAKVFSNNSHFLSKEGYARC